VGSAFDRSISLSRLLANRAGYSTVCRPRKSGHGYSYEGPCSPLNGPPHKRNYHTRHSAKEPFRMRASKVPDSCGLKERLRNGRKRTSYEVLFDCDCFCLHIGRIPPNALRLRGFPAHAAMLSRRWRMVRLLLSSLQPRSAIWTIRFRTCCCRRSAFGSNSARNSHLRTIRWTEDSG
jgi:hypothetical protein